MKILCSFSGGKDSMLALKRAIDDGHQPVVLMTTASSTTNSWFHDIDTRILDEISNSLNIPLEKIVCGMNETYTNDYEKSLIAFKEKYNIEGVVFGDIDVDAHLKWCTERCDNTSLVPIFPLWQKNRKEVVTSFISEGFSAYIKKVRKKDLSKNYLGKKLTIDLVNEFELLNIDVCGENGEYHTIVLDGPIFSKEVKVDFTEITESDYTYMIGAKLHE